MSKLLKISSLSRGVKDFKYPLWRYFMDPPVRKRGRPRKDEKRRGRKPNPATAKKISVRLKTTGNVGEDKKKKNAQELKTSVEEEKDRKKKIAQETKTAVAEEKGKKKKTAQELKNANEKDKNKKKGNALQLKTTGEKEKDKKKKFAQEQKIIGEEAKDNKRKKVSQELKTTVEEVKDKKKKIVQEVKITGEEEKDNKRKKISQELKTTVEEEKDNKRKKISQDPKIIAEEEKDKKKKTVQEVKVTGEEEKDNKRKKISQELKTTVEEEKDKKKKIVQEVKITGEEEKDNKRKKISQEPKTTAEEEKDKKKKIAQEVKITGEEEKDNVEEISEELKTSGDVKEDKKKKNSQKTKISSGEEKAKRKIITEELKIPGDEETGKIKKISQELKTAVSEEKDKEKKISDELKITCEEKDKIISEDLKIIDEEEIEKEKKISEKLKAPDEKEDQRKQISEEVKTACFVRNDETKVFSDELETTGDDDESEIEETLLEFNSADNKKAGKRKKISEELITVANVKEDETTQSSPLLNSDDDRKAGKRKKISELDAVVSTKEDETIQSLLHQNSSEDNTTCKKKNVPEELQIVEDTKEDATQSLPELNSADDKEADNIQKILPELESNIFSNTADDAEECRLEISIAVNKILDDLEETSTGLNIPQNIEPGMESVCIMQSPILEGKGSCNIKHCSVDSPAENSVQFRDTSVSSTPSDIRMELKLPGCYVLLHRLTDEEIHRSYASEGDNEIIYDVQRKTEELLRKTEEALDKDSTDEELITYRKNGTKRRMRATSKINADVFELYKRKRQGFINRRNRASHSDNSLDWSLDEFKTESDSGKVKKKLKRGRKYELDFEWCPKREKDTVQSTRKLRRHVRRPVIDSDSSTNDEEEILFDMYMNNFNSNKCSAKSAFQNSVPSTGHDTYEHVDTSTINISDSNLTIKQVKNTSQTTGNNSNSSSHNSDYVSGDIISNIINDMNKIKDKSIETYPKEQSLVLENSKIKPVQKGRKRLKISSENKTGNVDEEVAGLLIDMIKIVSTQVKQLDGTQKKFSKVCKWCDTPFATNKESEMMCSICCDLGKDKYYRTNSYCKRGPKLQIAKPPKENKATKRKNNTLSRVLKKLPKCEKQRIMYTEKSVSSEKGYNHCKSFITPKDAKESDIKNNNDFDRNVISNKISFKFSEGKKKSSQTRKESQSEEYKKSHVSSKQNQNDRPPMHLIQNKIGQDVPNENEQFSERGFELKSVETEGLFPLTFPNSQNTFERDKSPTLQISEKFSALNTAKAIGKKSVPESDKLLFKPGVFENQHDTYLFPPIPTVIVSNYCNDPSGLNLSHTYFQNEITHKHALKNSTSLSQCKEKTKSKTGLSVQKTNVSNTLVVPCQNPSITTPNLLPSNSSLTITTIPINNTINQILPFTSNTTSILNPIIPSSPNKVTIMPVVQSVMSLSDKSLTQPNAVQQGMETNSDLFSSNNFVNSQNLEIKITHVSSEKTYERMNMDHTELFEEVTVRPEISTTHVSSEKTYECMNTDHTQLYEEVAVRPEISITNVESKSSENILHTEMNSMQNASSLANVEDKSKLSLNTDELAEQSRNHSLKQLGKPSENRENAISSAMDILGAVSILAVIDLEKNPHSGLNIRIQVTKGNLAKLTSEKNVTPELNDKIASCQYNLQVLNIAKKYLSLYGSFAKVSDFLLRKAKMIQIKKEILFEESNQSSCMYSQSSQSNNSLTNSGFEDSRTSDVSSSPVSSKLENFSSCRLNERGASVNHIEKLQSQIAAMNNIQVSHYDSGGTVHHFPAEQIAALPPAVAAPTPVTPRNDCMGGESRETPSRGSGPRTPARPESAASQSEEQSLIQIKKEHLEADNSPPSQCAYSQNTTLPHISSQLTVMPDLPSLSLSEHSVPNTTIHQIPMSNTNHQLFSNQTNLPLQPVEVAPNRTISYNNNNQNFSDVLLNIASKHQVNPPVPSPEIRQNRQVLLGQQMYIQNDSRLCAKQPVPSVNNQFVIRPPFTTTANGGRTVIVNNPQVGQNALLTNVSNQQFYTSNQVSQLYYPPSSQITCVPTNTSTPSVAATQIQQAEVVPDQMVCAVCKNQATLRCKQCARVAYCNTTCAKTYWHQKHKMECKPLPS